MLPELKTTPRFPYQVDSTMMSTFDSCKRKFLWEYIYRLGGREKSPDLHAGGAFARGLEVARHELWSNNQPLEVALLSATREFIKTWGDYEPPEDHQKSFANTLGALWDYFREYPPGEDPVRPYMIEGKAATEFTFAIETEVKHPISGDPIMFVGRFDLLGYFNDALYIVDEKTTKSMGPTWARQWNMRGQFMGYCFAAQSYGLKVNSAIIRGLAIQKTQYKHMQAIVSYPQFLIDQWWEATNRKVVEMVHAWESSLDIRAWTQSFGDACSSYNGCPMQDMCTTSDIRSWSESYEERYWDPLADIPDQKPAELVA